MAVNVTSKNLTKYIQKTAAKAPKGHILRETVLAKSIDSDVINKEFQKALDKGKRYGMHLNKGDFFDELEKLGNFDPLKKK